MQGGCASGHWTWPPRWWRGLGSGTAPCWCGRRQSQREALPLLLKDTTHLNITLGTQTPAHFPLRHRQFWQVQIHSAICFSLLHPSRPKECGAGHVRGGKANTLPFLSTAWFCQPHTGVCQSKCAAGQVLQGLSPACSTQRSVKGNQQEHPLSSLLPCTLRLPLQCLCSHRKHHPHHSHHCIPTATERAFTDQQEKRRQRHSSAKPHLTIPNPERCLYSSHHKPLHAFLHFHTAGLPDTHFKQK